MLYSRLICKMVHKCILSYKQFRAKNTASLNLNINYLQGSSPRSRDPDVSDEIANFIIDF